MVIINIGKPTEKIKTLNFLVRYCFAFLITITCICIFSNPFVWITNFINVVAQKLFIYISLIYFISIAQLLFRFAYLNAHCEHTALCIPNVAVLCIQSFLLPGAFSQVTRVHCHHSDSTDCLSLWEDWHIPFWSLLFTTYTIILIRFITFDCFIWRRFYCILLR